jgi:N-acetylglucosaminyl-diphospho-decaprenol L-rhamnosyltransferase
MHVAVVIVGFRNPGDIQDCLEALAASTHTDFEVSICENGGAEAFRALKAVIPETLPGGQPVRIVQAPRNLGYAGGVNLGMAQAPHADAWWILNPDTTPESGALAACLARLAPGDCEAVGCTVYVPGGMVQSHGGRWQAPFARAVLLGFGASMSDPVDVAELERRQTFLNGACMLVSRRFLEIVGPMREEYFLYCEEVEWFLRAARRGVRLGYAPAARVKHNPGTTTGSWAGVRTTPKTPIYLNERNRLLVTRDIAPVFMPVAALAALAVLLIRFGRRRAWRQVGYAWQGWVAGLLNRRGPPGWITV